MTQSLKSPEYLILSSSQTVPHSIIICKFTLGQRSSRQISDFQYINYLCILVDMVDIVDMRYRLLY
jgi:hypothetical protein